MAGVLIRGSGVAAHCVAHLLGKAGVQTAIHAAGRSQVPAIMLSDAALALIRDVFGAPDLFRKAHRIDRRVVCWGREGGPRAVEHSAVVVSEQQLLEGLQEVLPAAAEDFRANWLVVSSRPLLVPSHEERFGSRQACAQRVGLRPGVSSSTCWIEALEQGWLFLVPDAPGSAWLLSVGQPGDELLSSSRVVKPQIEWLRNSAGKFPAYPRIVSPICGTGWLACGTAAMTFDPLCGDGTAHAVREAILAAAVIRASEGGEDSARLTAHYESRLIAGFERHLRLCLEFYRSGFGGPWWDAEAALLEQGMDWCRRRTQSLPGFLYRLNGFELQAAS